MERYIGQFGSGLGFINATIFRDELLLSVGNSTTETRLIDITFYHGCQSTEEERNNSALIADRLLAWVNIHIRKPLLP
jgi:hypothetical protein